MPVEVDSNRHRCSKSRRLRPVSNAFVRSCLSNTLATFRRFSCQADFVFSRAKSVRNCLGEISRFDTLLLPARGSIRVRDVPYRRGLAAALVSARIPSCSQEPTPNPAATISSLLKNCFGSPFRRDKPRRIPCFVGFWRAAIPCRSRKTEFKRLLQQTVRQSVKIDHEHH